MCPGCSKPLPLSPYFCQLANKMLQDVAMAKDRISHNQLSYQEQTVIEIGIELLGQLCSDGRSFGKRKKGQHRIQASDIIRTIDRRSPDTLSMMQLLRNIHNLCTATSSDVQTCALRSRFLDLIAQTRGKTSLQIITDVQSEIFRLSLARMLKEFQQHSGSFAGSQNSKLVGSVQAALEAMEVDHQLRLSKEQYQEYLHILQTTTTGSCLFSPKINPPTIPEITKGEWYKCGAAGHLYFKPVQYHQARDRAQCPECLKH